MDLIDFLVWFLFYLKVTFKDKIRRKSKARQSKAKQGNILSLDNIKPFALPQTHYLSPSPCTFLFTERRLRRKENSKENFCLCAFICFSIKYWKKKKCQIMWCWQYWLFSIQIFNCSKSKKSKNILKETEIMSQIYSLKIVSRKRCALKNNNFKVCLLLFPLEARIFNQYLTYWYVNNN